MFGEWAHEADEGAKDRAEQLKSTAKQGIADQDYTTAERAISELEAITMEILQRMPDFIVGHFGLVAKQRHFASDPELHDQLVERGIGETESGDFDALRHTIFELY